MVVQTHIGTEISDMPEVVFDVNSLSHDSPPAEVKTFYSVPVDGLIVSLWSCDAESAVTDARDLIERSGHQRSDYFRTLPGIAITEIPDQDDLKATKTKVTKDKQIYPQPQLSSRSHDQSRIKVPLGGLLCEPFVSRPGRRETKSWGLLDVIIVEQKLVPNPDLVHY